jgi:hypothetical protein
VARRPVWGGALAGLVVFGAVFAYLLPTTEPDIRAQVSTTETAPAPEREIAATIRFSPPGSVDGADWLRLIAYQGGERVVGGELEQIGPDTYRTEPFPVHGSWKSAIRFHRGSQMAAIPVFLPEDPAIPAAEVPAPASFSRTLVDEQTILMRELSTDVPGWATPAAWAVIGSGLLALLLGIGWALMRLATSAAAGGPPDGSRSASRPSASSYGRSEPVRRPAPTTPARA